MSALSHNLHRACAHTLKTATATALRQSTITTTTTTSLSLISSASPRLALLATNSFSTTAAAAVSGYEWSRPLRCLRCDQPGHRVRDCPNPKRCYNCGEEGHDARNCSKPMTCHRCGDEGHRAIDCPKRSVIPKCTYCADQHETEDCPHAKDAAKIRGAS